MKTILLTGLIMFSVIASPTLLAQREEKTETMVLLPVQNDPTVSFRIWFKTGSQDDPKGKEGLAYLTAQMISDGSTTKNSYEQVLDKLFPLAAGYGASTTAEMTVVTGRSHKDNLNDYYSLFSDAILAPAFKQDDLDRIKSQVLNQLENTLRYASDEELGKAILYTDIFAGSGYGHVTEGLIEAVKSITIDDVRNFYKQHYTRDNVVIGLGGGYDATLVKTLQQDIAKLPEGKPAPAPMPMPKAINGMHVTIIEKDAASTAISMGYPIDIVRGTKDWYALAVANSWFGEHRNSSSHLYQVIREARGLNYGNYSYIENYPRGGFLMLPPQNVCRRQQIFEIWIRPVPNEARHFALRAALREYKHLVENGLTKEQFELTRNFLNKYVLHYAATTMERLGYALDDVFYGINGSHLETYRKMMKEMTVEDVNNAIKKHWQYGNVQIALITKDAQSLKDALVNNTPSPITYQSPKPDNIMAEDKEISTFPLNIKAENVRIVPVADLFLK